MREHRYTGCGDNSSEVKIASFFFFKLEHDIDHLFFGFGTQL